MKYISELTQQQQNGIIDIKTGIQKRSFRYELLDKNENLKKVLTNVSECKLSLNDSAAIKRMGNITLVGKDPEIDFINDRVKVYVQLGNGVLTGLFPLGVYLLSSPVEKYSEGNVTTFQIDIYSKIQILKEDKVSKRFVIKANTRYTDYIKELMTGLSLDGVTESTILTTRDVSYNPGTAKLTIINDLIKQINYSDIYTDNDGLAIVKPYVLNSLRNPDYTYNTNEESIILNNYAKSLDAFNIPNVVTRVVTNSSSTLSYTYRNENLDDPTSIVSRGREIDDYKEISDIGDQTTLEAYVKREAEVLKQVYGAAKFASSINPLHEYQECIIFDNKVYIETGWTITLSTNGQMTHTLKEVVYV